MHLTLIVLDVSGELNGLGQYPPMSWFRQKKLLVLSELDLMGFYWSFMNLFYIYLSTIFQKLGPIFTNFWTVTCIISIIINHFSATFFGWWLSISFSKFFRYVISHAKKLFENFYLWKTLIFTLWHINHLLTYFYVCIDSL